ncbi:hypothetical protein B0T19DRAFT_116105 [Cercophora scortea]|uniref:Uncharacterized protein n=1 Tax=Cercophora scortea TaxID=314031 RepID=A0AAE0IY72_9PEZI|nr:hypothetical protein B0T19DRAFT_116105 [Cercophora scortea]
MYKSSLNSSFKLNHCVLALLYSPRSYHNDNQQQEQQHQWTQSANSSPPPPPLLLQVLLLLIATVSVSATPAPNITSITHSGNGCPQGFLTGRVVPDTDAANNKLQPILGPDIPITGNKRRNCQVHYRVALSSAYRMHVNAQGIDLVGYVPLVAGLKYQLYATMWLDSMDMMTVRGMGAIFQFPFQTGNNRRFKTNREKK